MERTLNVLLVFAMIVGAVLTYNTKYKAEAAARHVAELRHQVEDTKVALSTLRAEWAVLDQPSRLQGLVERHGAILNLAPFQPTQAVAITDIPMRAAVAPPAAAGPRFGIDDLITGAIGAPMAPVPLSNPARTHQR